MHPLFYDEATATGANVGPLRGHGVKLAPTDPDSNEIVPRFAARFAGDFMVTSQGDKEQIFLQRGAPLGSHLAVLTLSDSADDTVWARSPSGRLFGANTAGDTVDVVTGPFRPGSVFIADTPCDAGDVPGCGVPAELPGPAESVDRPDHRRPPARAGLRPAGHGLRGTALERGAGLTGSAPLALVHGR